MGGGGMDLWVPDVDAGGMWRVVAKLRLLLGGHPLERMERVQRVRDEMLETAAAEGWSWEEVEARARAARTRLQQGELPEAGDAIETYLAERCAHYRGCGYPFEDLREAVDGVKAKAAARRRLESESAPNRQ